MKYRYTPQNYECKAGHVTEFIVEDRERLKTRKCKKCGKKAEHVFVAATINALSKSTIVYEKPVDGQMTRMYVDPQEPSSIAHAEKMGYQRREIQGIDNIRRFEREVKQEMQEAHARRQRGEAEHKEEYNRQYRSDIRDLMNHGGIDSFTRDVLQEALNESSGYSRAFDPEFRCAAYSD